MKNFNQAFNYNIKLTYAQGVCIGIVEPEAIFLKVAEQDIVNESQEKQFAILQNRNS